MHRIILLAVLLLGTAVHAGELDVRINLDEANAALAIIAATADDRQPTAQDWSALWNSEGYRRLLERETQMGRADGFGEKLAAFLTSPEAVASYEDYARLAESWSGFDAGKIAARVHQYLPEGTPLVATLYPVIKHTQNTFVFDLHGDPAIFFSIDPSGSALAAEAIMTHELHHVGLSRCGQPADYAALSPEQQQVVDWLGIFGEGLAVLATAGDPMRHPHFYSEPAEYLVWERDVANFARDIASMEAFFQSILDGSLAESRQRAGLMRLIATEDVPQGPAYTVGWKMAAVIERYAGRQALLETVCDPREFIALYNQAAAQAPGLPRWSAEFLRRLRPASSQI